MAIIKVKACKCDSCGNIWLPRDINSVPIACGKCKSPYWNAGVRKAKSSKKIKEREVEA